MALFRAVKWLDLAGVWGGGRQRQKTELCVTLGHLNSSAGGKSNYGEQCDPENGARRHPGTAVSRTQSRQVRVERK